MNPGPPAPAVRFPRLGIVILAAVALAWGFHWPVMKIALEEIPPLTFRAVIAAGGGLAMLPAARLWKLSLAVPQALWLPLVVVSLLNVTGWYVASAYGLTYLASGRAVLIAYTMPLWAMILGALVLGETMTARRVAALVLGLGGIAVLMWDDLRALETAPVGAANMTVAALSWAAGTVMLKRFDWRISVMALSAWQLLIGGLPIVLGSLALEIGELRPVSALALAALAYSLVANAAGTYGWFKVVSLISATASSIGTLMIPIIGVISGNLVLGEPLGWKELSAVALVCSALALIFLRPAARDAGGG